MKELLQQYAIYNVWANQKLIECIQTLPKDLLNKEVPSSFNSIHGTLLHMWNAESIWWHRLKKEEAFTSPGVNFKGSVSDIATSLLNQNKLFNDWVSEETQEIINQDIEYTTTKGEQFRQPIYEVLLHVFNHGTYHRGQLVNILRQLGVQKIPQTDFIVWGRKK